jgi:phenylpropionate dioxygenase-like ring-hydroxylating dioxygenase large terminal subunit
MMLTFKAATRGSEPVSLPLRRFANPDVVCEGWYCIGPSRGIRPGAVVPASIGTRSLAVFRDLSGALHAVDRRCAHLGADLTLGTVVEKGLRCAFHQWCWGGDGSCTAGGGVAVRARTGAYDVLERWGLIWIWAGGAPAYDLPMPEPANRAHVLRLPSQRLACHGHVVLGNGLDLTHVIPVHGFRFVEDPAIEPAPPHRLTVKVHARFDPTLMRRLVGVAGRTARWEFTNIGPSLAWVKVIAPTPFELLWAARPLPDGGCATQTLFFLPRWLALARALPMMVATTWADRRVLEGLQFHPGFVASDAVFARYASLIEEMPEWR